QLAMVQILPQMFADEQPETSRLLAVAQLFTPEDIQLFYQIVLHGRSDLDYAPDEYSGFTMTLMRMLAFIPHTQHVVEAGQTASAVISSPEIKSESSDRPAVPRQI